MLSVFPDNCTNFYGPHSLSCIQNVWEQTECLKEGINHPTASNSEDITLLRNLSLKLVNWYFTITVVPVGLPTLQQRNITATVLKLQCKSSYKSKNCTQKGFGHKTRCANS